MKTENDLMTGRTPEYIKKLCELADGFEYKFFEDYKNINDWKDIIDFVLFPLLLRRAVEGWNCIKKGYIRLFEDVIILRRKEDLITTYFYFSDYTPSGNLTAVEMAIDDCLQNVLREERE